MSTSRLKLMIDDLSVESFDTLAGGPDGKGTVLAHARTVYPCESIDRCASYDGPCGTGNSCEGNCFETYDTDCFTNNGTCTEPSCRNEISCRHPSMCIPATCAC
jgi:hypothetical protein